MTGRLFAVERYDDSGTAAAAVEPFPTLPGAARFAAAVYLAADEVVIAFVESDEAVDEATLADSIRACGWRVDRIGPASWIRPATERARQDTRAQPASRPNDEETS